MAAEPVLLLLLAFPFTFCSGPYHGIHCVELSQKAATKLPTLPQILRSSPPVISRAKRSAGVADVSRLDNAMKVGTM